MRGRNLASENYRFALYKESASLDSATTRYLTGGEISGTGYSAGGNLLTSYAAVLNAGNAVLDFANTQWVASTFSTGGGLLYNDSIASNEAIAIFNFGSAKEVSSGTFTIQFPSPVAGSAVVEIGT